MSDLVQLHNKETEEEKYKRRFLASLASLNEAITQGKDISAMTLKLYYHVLKNYSIDSIEQACFDLCGIRKYKSLPPPAEIKEVINQNNTVKSYQNQQLEYKDYNFQETLKKNRAFWKTLSNEQKKAWKKSFLNAPIDDYSKRRALKKPEKIGSNITFLLFLNKAHKSKQQAA